ncbi:MAG: hypothetical protein ACR2GP_05365 [Burkholderiaceae bacterium]
MFPSDRPTLRDEIAAVAARLIAEDGMDYAGAKRRAVRELTGDARERLASDCMPDNAAVEAAVRAHQALFMADTQPVRLASLRRTAVEVMRFLDAFEPCLTGAAFNGTAGEHSDVHLLVFNDNAKDIEIFLLNAGIEFEVSEYGADRRGTRDATEVLSFVWPPRSIVPRRNLQQSPSEDVHLVVLDPRDQRSSRMAKADRGDLRAVEMLIAGDGSRTLDDAGTMTDG